jgi:uncharacterized pyridoxal phosphate-containing UPF0001 family protein
MQHENNSEVARLMELIRTEHEAARRGLMGIAEGTAKHVFIHAHMKRMWELKDKLGREVSDAEALAIVCRVLLGMDDEHLVAEDSVSSLTQVVEPHL